MANSALAVLQKTDFGRSEGRSREFSEEAISVAWVRVLAAETNAVLMEVVIWSGKGRILESEPMGMTNGAEVGVRDLADDKLQQPRDSHRSVSPTGKNLCRLHSSPRKDS